VNLLTVQENQANRNDLLDHLTLRLSDIFAFSAKIIQ